MLKRYQVDYQLNGDTANTFRTVCLEEAGATNIGDFPTMISVLEWCTPDDAERVQIVGLKYLGLA